MNSKKSSKYRDIDDTSALKNIGKEKKDSIRKISRVDRNIKSKDKSEVNKDSKNNINGEYVQERSRNVVGNLYKGFEQVQSKENRQVIKNNMHSNKSLNIEPQKNLEHTANITKESVRSIKNNIDNDIKNAYNTKKVKMEENALKENVEKNKNILKELGEKEKIREEKALNRRKIENENASMGDSGNNIIRQNMRKKQKIESTYRIISISLIFILLITVIVQSVKILGNNNTYDELLAANSKISELNSENATLNETISQLRASNDALTLNQENQTDVTNETQTENIGESQVTEPADDEIMPNTYTVSAGDSLWSISDKIYGSSDYIDEIESLNNIRNGVLQVGQVLDLPPQ